MAIEKRGKHYRVRVSDSALGVRHTVGSYPNLKLARAAETKAMAELAAEGFVSERKDIRFGALCDDFLSRCTHLNTHTLGWYENALKPARRHFGENASVRRMTKADVTAYAAALAKAGKADRTVKGYVKAVGTVMEHAIEGQYRNDNPARKLKNVRPGRATSKPEALTKEQHLRLVAKTRTQFDGKHFDGYRVMFSVWPFLGLRVGEMLGLTWENVHLDEGFLVVDRQLRRDGTLDPVLKTPKARRTVHIPEPARAQLLGWKRDCPPTDDGLVFPAPRGRAQNRQQTYKIWQEACTAAGIGGNMYVLRHSFASWYLTARTNPKWVSEQMGHEDASITLQTYAHLIPNTDSAAVANFEIWYDSQAVGDGSGEDVPQICPNRSETTGSVNAAT